jgi:Host cell surface-exposed lipoprotein
VALNEEAEMTNAEKAREHVETADRLWTGMHCRRALVVVLAAFVCVGIASGCGGDDTSSPAAQETTTKEAAPQPPPPPPPPEEPKKAEETVSQQNARESAESYLDTSAFSREGLIKQLKFEGYSQADAVYAVNAVSPNWNEQAAKAAQAYLDTSSFSRSGLIQQLMYEGYTRAQAEYGAKKVGL